MPMYAGSEMVIPYLGNKPIRNQDKTIIENGEYTSDQGYTGLGKVTVNVSSSASGTINITENGTYNVTQYANADVNVEGGEIRLQEKIARQNGLVEPDSGYNGLSSVDVGVGQIGETYQTINKTGSKLLKDQKCYITYRESTPDSNISRLDYMALPIFGNSDLFFISNPNQTVAKPSSYDASTDTIINEVSGNSVQSLIIQYDELTGETFYSGGNHGSNRKNDISVKPDGTVVLRTNSSSSYDSWSIHNDSIYFQCHAGNARAWIVINGVEAGSCNSCYEISRITPNVWRSPIDNNICYCVTSWNKGGSQDSYHRFLYKIDLVNNTCEKVYTTPYSYFSYSGNYVNGITSDKKLAILSQSNSGSSRLLVYKINYSNETMEDVTYDCGLPTSAGVVFLNSVGNFAIFIPYNSTQLHDCSLYRYNQYDEKFHLDTSFSFPYGTYDTITNSSGISVTANNELNIISAKTNNNIVYYKYARNDSWVIVPYNQITENALTGYAKTNIEIAEIGDVIVGTAGVNDSLTIIPSTSQQTFTAQNGHGFSPITVNAVTSDIDQNISPENIKKNISILGVEGNYEGDNTDIEIITAQNMLMDSVFQNQNVFVVPYFYKNWQENSAGPTHISSDCKLIFFQPSSESKRSIRKFNAEPIKFGYGTQSTITLCFQTDDVFKTGSTQSLAKFGVNSNGTSLINDIEFVCKNDNYLGFILPGNVWLNTNISATSVSIDSWIYVKLEQNNLDVSLSVSSDGSSWTQTDSYTYASGTVYQLDDLWYHLMWESRYNYGNTITFKLDKCFININGHYWEPYTYASGYGIINNVDLRTDIISGIVQDSSISPGSNGNVKILKPIN